MKELLNELNQRGIKITVNEDRLEMRAPKGTLTDELRNAIAIHKTELLAMLRSSTPQSEFLIKINPQPQSRFEPFELLDVQHAYWIGRGSYIESGNVSTHLYLEYERAGLDIQLLEKSLNKVIERHDMLRAVIQPNGLQRILQKVPYYQIQVVDLQNRAIEDQERTLLEMRERLSHQVLPADKWPLFEISSSQLDGDLVRLHISLDMLVMDALSISLFFMEWGKFYEDLNFSPIPLDLTYRDYALTQKTFSEHQSFKKAETYWLNRIDTLPHAPNLPLAAHTDEPIRSKFVRYRHHLDNSQWDKLKKKAQKSGLTPSLFLAAAFGEVLRLWAKEQDFTLDMTLFNRLPLHPQVNQIIGDFTSVILLEMRAYLNESFIERARRLQQQLSQDLEHLQFSGLQVLRERARRLGSGLKAAMPVVFTSALGITGEGDEGKIPSCFGRYVYGISQTPQVWLDHQIFEKNGQLIYQWDFIEAMYPEGMIKDMFDSFSALMERFADDSTWNGIGCAALLPGWQQAMQRQFNSTKKDISELTLHELFAKQVGKQHDKLAVIAADRQLSYGDLHAYANRIGRYLRDQGVSKNNLVVISMEKGWEQLAAVLGILYSGAAYLPIDPSLPQERRWQLLAQGEASIVITQSHLRSHSWPTYTNVVTINDDAVELHNSDTIDFIQTPDDLAYVIFTSGSTGRPKGVMIDHRGAANTIQDINARFDVGQSDRILALSALSFDLSVYDIFGVLAAGGVVVMPSRALALDPVHWSNLIDEHGVTLWNSVPQLMQIWLDYLQDARSTHIASLRCALLSGDWIPVSLPDSLRTLCLNIEVISLGGATEASIWSVFYPVNTVNPKWKSIPYGKPLANQQLHIFNADLEYCPVWMPGEIYIGGKGLAKGYWRDEKRTAESFITHPRTGERLYKTGDLARYLPNGIIEFLGREDFQVKINGYRIELGEIESSLRAQPEIHHAVVTTYTNPENLSKQLVAYVVPKTRMSQQQMNMQQRWLSLLEVGEICLQEYKLHHEKELKTFSSIWQVLQEISPIVMALSFAQMGFFQFANEEVSVISIMEMGRISPKNEALIKQWLATLVECQILELGSNQESYRCIAPLNVPLLNQRLRQLDTIQSEKYQPLINYYKRCANLQIALLRGEQAPLDLLFPNGSMDVTEVLYRLNPVSAAQNKVAAAVLNYLVNFSEVKKFNVLEVGAGTGATTKALLPFLPKDRTRYQYTDVSAFFFESVKPYFAEYPFLDFNIFDINNIPQSQGLDLQSFDIIIAANVLHDAVDIDKTLQYLHSLLVPEGILILIEGTVNTPVQMVTVGFLESFGHFRDFRQHTNLPLLSVFEWKQRIELAKFSNCIAIPDEGAVSDALVQHVLLAQASVDYFPTIDTNIVREKLKKFLPDYMVPRHYVLLDKLPLSINGKIDYAAMPIPDFTSAPMSTKSDYVKPITQTQQKMYAIWREALRTDEFGIEDNFFEIGGDSLIAIQLINHIKSEFQMYQVDQAQLVQQLFANPTVIALSLYVDRHVVSFEL